ncbi:MAG TPA: nucleoside-triphosphatase [Acidobacteriota bacterium]|nr:nucleoside-triphosphatase [Acidobacteriota bacterium]HQP75299.1 nucleoside-triphosphatase [Acidobacteriota bacterium]
MRIIISGDLHVGKSSLVASLTSHLPAGAVGRVLTVPLFREQEKVGFCLEAPSGDREVFAHADWAEEPRFGPFGLKPEVFADFGCRALAQAADRDWLVIDELGAMEEHALPFAEAVADAFRDRDRIVAVVQRRALVDWVRRIGLERLDGIFCVHPDNREAMANCLSRLLLE